jgi:hypothetical protein
MPNARSSCLAVVPAYNEAGTIEGVVGALRGETPQLRLQIVAQHQAILEQRLSEVEHAREVASGDEVRTLEPLLRGDD